MSRTKLLRSILAITLLLLSPMGCGAPASVPATEVPISTSTPEPPTGTATAIPPTGTSTLTPTVSGSGPKPGQWAGDHNVSFTVTERGTVAGFSITVAMCDIALEDEIPVDANGGFGFFTINPEGVLQGNDVSTGTDFNAEANFESPTSMTGVYSVQLCAGSLFFGQTNVAWGAEWQSP